MSIANRTEQQIATMLWNMCDALRGRIAPVYFRNVVLSIFFLKYVSDVYDSSVLANRIKYGGDEERMERAMRYARFVVPERSHFAYLYKRCHEYGIGEMINRALAELVEANGETFGGEQGRGMFGNVDFDSLELGDVKHRNDFFRRLFGVFSEVDLCPGDEKGRPRAGEVFTFLVERISYAGGKATTEFATPGQVCRLLAKLTKSGPGARICDPTTGTGGLLIAAGLETGSSNFSLYGQEIDYNIWMMAKMNMILHGFDSTVIRLGDTLLEPKLLDGEGLMQFDTVLSHPPFSINHWGADSVRNDPYNRFFREIPPDSRGDWAFISHLLAVAKEDTGKVGVIVPHGVLFRAGSEARIRRSVVEELSLEAVIGLPANLFYSTAIPAAILLFNKGKKTGEMLFIDASKEYEKVKKQHLLRDEDICHVVDTYTRFKKGGLEPGILEKGYAYIATLEEIRENEYNLTLPIYVDTLEEEEAMDSATIYGEIGELEKKLAEVQTRLASCLKKLNE